LQANQTALMQVSFSELNHSSLEKNEIIDRTIEQLDQYFEGTRTNFDIPLMMKGTSFQRQVWNALQAIEYGKTVSYQDIAIRIGNPKAVRAVGMANNRNPIVLIVPCHRVIGKNGSLVGYGGGLDVKKWLLDFEQKSK